LDKDGLQLVRCAACSMIYANPIAAEFASGQYYDAAGAEYYLSPAKLESDYAPVRFERELRRFRKQCRRGAVLDVGCSSGAFLFQLGRRFPGDYSVAGMDASGPPLDYAASRAIRVIRGNFPEHDFGGETFDAVTFWAVLEHLPEPGRFMSQAASILNEGGHCFVLVPNLKSLAVRLLGRKYRYLLPQHVNYFTAATLQKLAAAERRFRVVSTGFSHFNPLVILQDWRRSGAPVSDAERAKLLERTTAHKQNPAMKPLKLALAGLEAMLSRLGLADNIVLVLRKTTA
jgi:2-polyprenyl-3-methyl-5-hydroxy-6-metoxy-1,4-benzoquinol methylase